jgi:transposase-like protein
MAEKRRVYTREFKVEAVRMLESGEKNGHEIERDLGIGSGQIYRWRMQLAQEAAGSGIRAFPGNGKPRDQELADLLKENKNLREERDILRKAVAIFSRPQK